MSDPQAEPPKGITLKWGDASQVPLTFADNLHWRTTPDRCYLTVGQVYLPVREAPFPSDYAVDILPVARLVLTPDALRMWAAELAAAVKTLPQPSEKQEDK